jgi:hypothetical protein
MTHAVNAVQQLHQFLRTTGTLLYLSLQYCESRRPWSRMVNVQQLLRPLLLLLLPLLLFSAADPHDISSFVAVQVVLIQLLQMVVLLLLLL